MMEDEEAAMAARPRAKSKHADQLALELCSRRLVGFGGICADARACGARPLVARADESIWPLN